MPDDCGICENKITPTDEAMRNSYTLKDGRKVHRICASNATRILRENGVKL